MSGARRATTRPRWGASIAALALALILAAATVDADSGEAGQGASEPQYAYDLAHELMSPYCPGRSLASCPSDQAAELVQWIVLQEAAGATREEVVAILEARFGDVIKSAPEPEGWGLAAWMLPGAMLALGALAVAIVLRRLVDRPGAESGVASSAAATRVRAAPIRPRDARDDAELARLVDAELEASRH